MEKESRVDETIVAVGDGHDQPATGAKESTTIVARQTKVNRIFNYSQLFFFALTFIASWEAILGNLSAVFFNGGPRSLSWGIIVVLVGAQAQAASLAEMSALHPIAGAQYHWTSVLAPPRYRRSITWIQGWMTWFAWISLLAGICNIIAYITQGIVIANYPNYEPHTWHLTLMIFALLIIQSLMANYAFWLTPWIELLGGVLHVVLFIIFIAVLLATTKEKHTANFVFFGTSTASGWANDYLSWNLGLLTPSFGFVGFDAAVHVAEETRRAKYVVPRVMFWTIAVNGVMAYFMILTILFCVGDYDEVLSSPYPMLAIILNATGSLGAATTLCCGLLVLALAASLGSIVSTSRLTWAWARDGGLPKYFSYIDPTYQVPIRALWLPVFITMLLSLLNIGSTAAFQAFVALSSMGLYCSYVIAICCMIYARLSGKGFERGEWNLDRWGLPINIFAVIYSCYVFVFLAFPLSIPVTGPTMNYASPLFGFAVLFAVSTWWIWGRRKWPGLNAQVVETVLANSDRDMKD